MRFVVAFIFIFPSSSFAIDFFEAWGVSTAGCEADLTETSPEIAAFAQFLVRPKEPIGLPFRQRGMEMLDRIFGTVRSAGCFSGFRENPPGQRQRKIFAAETPDEVMDISGFLLGEFWYDLAPQEVVSFGTSILIESTFAGAARLPFPARREVFFSEPEMLPVRYRLRIEHLDHHEVEHFVGDRIRLHTSPDDVQRASRTKMREIFQSSLRALDERCRAEGFACFEGSLHEVDNKLEIVLARDLEPRAMSLVLASWTSNLQRGAVFKPAF